MRPKVRLTGALMGSATTLLVSGLLTVTPALAEMVNEVSLPDDPLEGRNLFSERGCYQCHGIAGNRPGIGPNLGEGRFAGTFLELGAALWNHVPGMSVTFDVAGLPWPILSEQETIELVVFLNFIDYLGRPGVSERGAEIFASKGCDACHAVGGGKAHRGPDLEESTAFASPLYVAQQIWNHGPSMFASMRELGMQPPTFEEGDLADLSAYIRQRAAPRPRERTLLAPGNPNRGAELFVAEGCSKCHGTEGRGGDGGPNLARKDLHRSAEGIAGTMWNHALAMSETMRARGIGWPELENSELADLVAFLYFLPFDDPPGDPQRGAEVFSARSCADCHGQEASDVEAPTLGDSPMIASSSALVSAMWNHAPTMKKAILREGRPWPDLAGEDLRDLLAFLKTAEVEP
ncbi:MAG: c-type cytochrome [Acidobacteriota bacterium]